MNALLVKYAVIALVGIGAVSTIFYAGRYTQQKAYELENERQKADMYERNCKPSEYTDEEFRRRYVR